MPLKGASLLEGATFTPSGGSAVVYSETASTGNGTVTSAASVADYRVRPNTIHTTKLPVYDMASKKYSKEVNKLVHRRPKLDTDDSLVFNLARIDVEVHPISTLAERRALWDWIAQVATDPDYAGFRDTGALS